MLFGTTPSVYPFLVLNFCFHIVDGVRRLYLECDGFSGQCLDESKTFLHVSEGVRLYLKRIRVGLDRHDSPTAVRSLREGHIHHHSGLRPFTRGLPNPKRSYHERSHYLAY